VWDARALVELQDEVNGKAGERRTLRDAMHRYADEVAPTHKGARWELVRLAAMERHRAMPAAVPLAKLTAAHFADWQRARSAEIGPGSLRRERSLLGSVLSWARRDWAWMQHAPLADVRAPQAPPHSERVISWGEVRAMLRALSWVPEPWHKPQTARQVVAGAFLLSLRTGMRAGELLDMEWPRVSGRVAKLPRTKNGTARAVPLSAKALRLLERMRGCHETQVFPVAEGTRDATFRSARTRAGLSGFTFHSARHTAATRIGATVGQPGRPTFPEFCRIFGWQDPKNALIYVNTSAETLAGRL
jgi:integrase